MGSINFLAVIVAAIVSMILGALWYSPVLFGNIWMKLSGFNMKDMKKAKQKGMAKSYILNFVAVVVMAYVVSFVLRLANASTAVAGLFIGILLWLGFIATTMLGGILWENKPVELYFLNILYYLVSLMIMGAILAVWV